jgi:hypothetical protein
MSKVLWLCLCCGLLALGGCTAAAVRPAVQAVTEQKDLAVPVAEDWEVKVEAPDLTDERRGRLPFQTEESVRPAGTRSVPPSERQRIEVQQ